MGFFSRKTAPPEPGVTYDAGVVPPVVEAQPVVAAQPVGEAQPVGASSSDQVEVSATDGPMPPMIEQFKAIHARGGTTVDISLTNTNLVDDEELLELVELEIREAATTNGLAVNTITRR